MKTARKNGFNLIEIVIVMAIVGIMFAILISALTKAKKKTERERLRIPVRHAFAQNGIDSGSPIHLGYSWYYLGSKALTNGSLAQFPISVTTDEKDLVRWTIIQADRMNAGEINIPDSDLIRPVSKELGITNGVFIFGN